MFCDGWMIKGDVKYKKSLNTNQLSSKCLTLNIDSPPIIMKVTYSSSPTQLALPWVRYLSEVDGKRALIAVNSQLKTEIQSTHPYMGWIRLSPALENATDSFEATLILFQRFAPGVFSVMETMPTHLVGYVAEQNEITLIFYSRERISLRPVLKAFVRDWKTWNLRPGQIRDEDWETYHDLLYPAHWEQKQLRYFSTPF